MVPELLEGDIEVLLWKLHSEGVKHIWVDGGITISQFLPIIDEMSDLDHSCLARKRYSSLPKEGKELPLDWIESNSYPSGLVQVRYQRAAAI